MANGTAGLGQDTTVFDFSRIGQTGLMMDEAKRQRKAQFVKDNADLYSSIDDSGIREVDMPYINEQVENAMELSALAQKTRNPEDAQKARLAMENASRLAATSRAANLQTFEAMSKFRNSDQYARDPERYEQFYREHQNATALTSNNQGQVGQAILFEAPRFYDLEKGMEDFIDADATTAINASYERSAWSRTYSDGQQRGKDKAEINVEKKDAAIQGLYESQMHGNDDFRNAIEAQVMSDYFGTTDLSMSQTARFQEMRAYGRELTEQYKDDIEALRADTRFINNPVALAQAEEAYNMENRIMERGYELYYDAVAAKAQKATNESDTRSYLKRGGSGGYDANKDYALSSGSTAEEALGGNVKIKSNAMQNLEGSRIGYSSIQGMKLRPRGTGAQKVIVGGVLAQKKSDETWEYFAIEYQPSADILTKIEEGGDNVDAAALLAQVDANVVPLSSARSGIPSQEIAILQQNAFLQAGGKGTFTDPQKSNKAPR
jgi:hypothetical protein